MMFLLVTSLLLVDFARADTLTVKQDGSGDYQYIQDAIDHASNGSEIIVYPGIYYENLNFMGKTLTLASTYLLNPVDSLVWQTIIDGHQNGSCIMLVSGESTCRIVGFTIQHGSGSIFESFDTQGGGVLMDNANTTIENCIIQYNTSVAGGGGLYIRKSNVFLKGNTLRFNHSNHYGGGLYIASSSNIVFNHTVKNNIYCNYASLGTDLSISYTCNSNHIWLDTATVVNLNHYYMASTNMFSFPYNGITYEANFGKVQQQNTDLYVSPNGSNENSGLSADDPLQTLAFALLKVVSDSTRVNTIHLANGIYSPSLSGEHFPQSFKSNVRILGESRKGTILDAEFKSAVGFQPAGGTQTKLEKFTVRNGFDYLQSIHNGGIMSLGCNKITVDSLAFEGSRGFWVVGLTGNWTDTIVINNCLFKGNKGQYVVVNYQNDSTDDMVTQIRSSRFIDNGPDTTDARCFPCVINGRENLAGISSRATGYMVNCEFSGNESQLETGVGQVPGFLAIGNVDFDIVNSTFADNKAQWAAWGAAVGVGNNSNVNVVNSILYGNIPYQANLLASTPDKADTLYISYSCVENGSDGVFNLEGNGYLEYDEETNISSDPEWFEQGEFPYSISGGSPCIDAGTMDLPEGIELPEYDLAGNPRVYGASVDMGAYEWSPVGMKDNLPLSNTKEKLLKASPNPFSWGTYIGAKYSYTDRIRLLAINGSGQVVKQFLDLNNTTGQSEMQWDGTGLNGSKLPPGIYHLLLIYGEQVVEIMPLVKQ